MNHAQSNPRLFHIAQQLLAGLLVLAVSAMAHAEPVGTSTPIVRAATAQPNPTPWAERLKGQTLIEDALEGRAERAIWVDRQHQRMMEQTAESTAHSHKDGGFFGATSMLHQYGAGQNGEDYLLMSDSKKEPISHHGGRCPTNAPVKAYDISAIEVEITLNQWLDFYAGYMYVLTEHIAQVRAEEAQNAAARDKDAFDPGAVTNGLQSQWIQPLVIRGNQGDCVKLTVRNQLSFAEDVSLHIQGSGMVVSRTGHSATTTNPDAIAAQGKTINLEWYIHPDTQEGARQFHSYSNDRELTVLGLFGAFIVEPRGSVYLDPIGTGSATEASSGWQVMIKNGTGPDFREFVIIYHEVGDEAFRPLNKHGDFLPQRDPITDVYRPGSRALNYRSEPFGLNNMQTQHEYFGFEDESMGYSGYTFGDPSTTIPRSYLGDPAKFRLVHGGSEVFHSHHPHGGSIRWQRSPRASDQMPLWYEASNGPIKYPVIRTKSDRVDVEVIGPSEALDLETECGSGLCQWQAGDFLFHCHVAHHYLAGMWAYWRVYNTLQVGHAHTDVMPDLRELPDRPGRMQTGLTSEQLIGKTVDWFGARFTIINHGKSNWKSNPAVVTLTHWVEMQLPTRGQPGHTDDERAQILAYDATVFDWVWVRDQAMNEKESTIQHPKYRSPSTGQRRPILFEPLTGKVAWPWMTPHFGKRPPFALDHNPAPWLEMIHVDASGNRTTEPARPGENGRWSLCPEHAGSQQYNIHFIRTPIELSAKEGAQPPIVDTNGLIFVAHEEEAAIRADNDLRRPLVFRANIYDCIDYMLTSEWDDDDSTNFQSSKVNTHFHFVQFDTQGSDGVITGMSYEQSVRPFTMLDKKSKKGLPMPMNAALTKPAKAGQKTITVSNTKPYHVGTLLLVGADNVNGHEVRRIAAIKGTTLSFTTPLAHDHPKHDIVTVEFVRQRLWADADVGSVYCHDHAFGPSTWQHGGICSLIIEPIGSTYHDPTTGASKRTGPIVDVHGVEPVGYGVGNSFRELVVQIMDTIAPTVNMVTAGNPPGQSVAEALESGKSKLFSMPDQIQMTPMLFLNGGTHTTGSAIGFRVEPFAKRLAVYPEVSTLFSSQVHGDPSTPLLRTYLGDTIVFRLLSVTANETHVFTVAGHTFLTERYAGDANRKHSIHVGIAERYDLVVPQAGGPRLQPGDYLYLNGRTSKFSDGSWGIVRVLDQQRLDLQPLPNKYSGLDGIPRPLPLCPKDASVKTFNVVALDYPTMNFNPRAPETIEVDFGRTLQLRNPKAKIYALEEEEAALATGLQPMPLTLRANVGDCITIRLTNKMKDSRASFSALGLAFDPKDSLGLNLGRNPGDQTVGPGATRTYTYYADPFNGETASLVWDWGNPLENQRNGLFGALIIGPKGSSYRDPKTGTDVSLKNTWVANVLVDQTISGNENRSNYRDAALFFQDEDNILGTSFMPYLESTAGLIGVNYRAEPYQSREDKGCTPGHIFQPCNVKQPEDPVTPLIEAHAGDPVRVHVFGASSEQNGVFGIEKHEWPLEPFMSGADQISVVEFASSESLDVFLPAAGGYVGLPGDYTWSNQRLPYSQSGQWGYLRVFPVGDPHLLPLIGVAPGVIVPSPLKFGQSELAIGNARNLANAGSQPETSAREGEGR